MDWILFWIFVIALTQISAYKYSRPRYYHSQDRYHEESQQQSGYNQSIENDNSFDDQQGIRRNISLNYDIRIKSDVWSSKTAIGNFNTFSYYRTEILGGRVRNPSSKTFQRKNWASVNKNVISLAKSKLNLVNVTGADFRESRNILTTFVTKDCEENGYCENSPDYPYEYVEALLAKLPDTSNIFNMDVEPEIEERGNLYDIKTLCEADVRVIKPDIVRTNTGKWVFVIKGRNKKVQGVRGTECQSPGGPCKNLRDYPREWYIPICVQKYTHRTLWALGDSGEMVQVITRIGSCCICELLSI